ncbi:hypothetical protein [Cupriavidus sp. SK-4]|uniref:hypothetical protein n=1 Tax=Cupriavidus sp. SK-4 TaxID=574750 RepID=UPI000AD416D6|nr:hypothetical protein [Cupriavidus sp. SK-4]
MAADPYGFSMEPVGVSTAPGLARPRAVSAAAFSIDRNPPDAIRVCLGGRGERDEIEESLQIIAVTLDNPHHLHSAMLSPITPAVARRPSLRAPHPYPDRLGHLARGLDVS